MAKIPKTFKQFCTDIEAEINAPGCWGYYEEPQLEEGILSTMALGGLVLKIKNLTNQIQNSTNQNQSNSLLSQQNLTLAYLVVAASKIK